MLLKLVTHLLYSFSGWQKIVQQLILLFYIRLMVSLYEVFEIEGFMMQTIKIM